MLSPVYNSQTRDWEVASAGHPPPVLARPGAQAGFLELAAGLPLGVGGGRYEATHVRPSPGSTLVLYTDGLIETPGSDIGSGMDKLAAELAKVSDLPVGQVCESLLTSLAPSPTDDIAVLLART